jgi:monoamine oxidase
VENFQAAELDLVSARALGGEADPSGDEGAQRLGRVFEGYDHLIAALAAPVSRIVRHGWVVRRVGWSRGDVRVQSRTAAGRALPTVRARACVVALPLGVLKSPAGAPGHVAFEPPLAEKSAALSRLAVGHVARLVLRFREPFWESPRLARRAGASLARLGFLHADGAPFPVWWTQYPERVPQLVAWCGGGAARDLIGRPLPVLRERAIAALARALGLTARDVRRDLRRVWHHDWAGDPLARGAYSYVMVGGVDAPRTLARSLARTLFFAGEATVSDGRIGTVDGAIASGQRAAAQLLRAVDRSRS